MSSSTEALRTVGSPKPYLEINPQYSGMSITKIAELSAIRHSSVEIAVIKYGLKVMHVSVTKDGEIVSYILNLNTGSRITNETTECYKRLKEFIQQLANSNNVMITYKFNTQSSAMKFWAMDKGKQIFPWAVEIITDYPNYSNFVAYISPSSRQDE